MIYTACEGQSTQLPCTMTLLQPSVVMGRSPAGKHSRTTDFLSVIRVLVMKESSLQLKILYVTPNRPTTNHARLQLFGKAKNGLEMLPPRRNTLKLHAIRANYQAKIWLQANKENIDGDMQL